jgi:hypothetical protein
MLSRSFIFALTVLLIIIQKSKKVATFNYENKTVIRKIELRYEK